MKVKILIFFMLLSGSCAYAQFPISFRKKVMAMPAEFERPTATTENTINGCKLQVPWIVFSDRAENVTTTVPGGMLEMKKLKFMEPFFVVKERDGYLQLSKYDGGITDGRKIIDKKAGISYGWIHKSKLLLWRRSMVSSQTGFTQKAIVIINGPDPLRVPQRYFDQTDSVYVYGTPELKNIVGKVKLHDISYIFKQSADRKAYLIGNTTQLLADSAVTGISGWLGAEVLHYWGERLYLSPSDDVRESIDPLLDEKDVILTGSPLLSDTCPKSRSSNSVPDEGAGLLSLASATDVFDKSRNTLTTINGSKLAYPEYLKLRKRIHKTNIVFLIDGGGSMNKHFPSLINSIQSLESTFKNSTGITLNYGAVVYREPGNCSITEPVTIHPIHPDFRRLMGFLEVESSKTEQCSKMFTSQPLAKGLRSALDLLRSHPYETNLVIVFGSTGNSNPINEDLTREFGQLNTRLLAIQMYSDYHQIFNDFVLQMKKTVIGSAFYAAEVKKSYLVNGEVLTSGQMYNVSVNDSLPFYLDYPANSLIQGGVIFPTKGDVTSNKLIANGVSRFMDETRIDIHKQMSALDSALRLRGIATENLSQTARLNLDTNMISGLANQMPHNAFKYFYSKRVSAESLKEQEGKSTYTLVLSTAEFRQIKDIISTMVGHHLQPDAMNFRRKLYKSYLALPGHYLDKDIPGNTIRSMSLGTYFKTIIGMPLNDTLLNSYKVADLRNDGRMSGQHFEKYIKYLLNAEDRIQKATQDDQQFISNGKTFYFVTAGNFTENSTATKNRLSEKTNIYVDAPAGATDTNNNKTER